MTRDITVQRHLDETLQLSDRTARFAAIMASAHQDDVAVVRAMAALGAIVRPLGVPDDALDLASPAHRRALLDCAVAALRSGRH